MKKMQTINTLRQHIPSTASYPPTNEFKAYIAPRNLQISTLIALVFGSLIVCALIMIGGASYFTSLKLHSVWIFFICYFFIVVLLFIAGRVLNTFFPCHFNTMHWYNNIFNMSMLLPVAGYTFWERLDSSVQADVNIIVFVVLVTLSSTLVVTKKFIWCRALVTMATYLTFEIMAKSSLMDTVKNFAIMGGTVVISIVVSHILLRISYADFKLTQELMTLNETLENLSRTDGLTALPDRRVFQETLASEWARASRHHYPITIFVIDIDYFKQYNDTYGHLEGDKAIRAVATVLKENIQRSGNLISRFGGDEFAAVLPHTTETEANVFAEILRSKVYDLHIPHACSTLPEKTVTVSIGSATMIPMFGKVSDELFALADAQLYKAKDMGRNRVAVIAE